MPPIVMSVYNPIESGLAWFVGRPWHGRSCLHSCLPFVAESHQRENVQKYLHSVLFRISVFTQLCLYVFMLHVQDKLCGCRAMQIRLESRPRKEAETHYGLVGPVP